MLQWKGLRLPSGSAGAINWVWSPQVVWTPEQGRYMGQVNMHLPDAWGYVVFADPDGKLAGSVPAGPCDPSWPARQAAAVLYYAAKAYKKAKGSLPTTVAQMEKEGLLRGAGLDTLGGQYSVSAGGGGSDGAWSASAAAEGWTAIIGADRLLRVTESRQSL